MTPRKQRHALAAVAIVVAVAALLTSAAAPCGALSPISATYQTKEDNVLGGTYRTGSYRLVLDEDYYTPESRTFCDGTCTAPACAPCNYIPGPQCGTRDDPGGTCTTACPATAEYQALCAVTPADDIGTLEANVRFPSTAVPPAVAVGDVQWQYLTNSASDYFLFFNPDPCSAVEFVLDLQEGDADITLYEAGTWAALGSNAPYLWTTSSPGPERRTLCPSLVQPLDVGTYVVRVQSFTTWSNYSLTPVVYPVGDWAGLEVSPDACDGAFGANASTCLRVNETLSVDFEAADYSAGYATSIEVPVPARADGLCSTVTMHSDSFNYTSTPSYFVTIDRSFDINSNFFFVDMDFWDSNYFSRPLTLAVCPPPGGVTRLFIAVVWSPTSSV